MNRQEWQKWLGFGLYKKLWSVIGGRPWTFIWRDIYHLAPYVIQCVWFGYGVVVVVFIAPWLKEQTIWVIIPILWAIRTEGFISGHFHWGTKYIPRQPGK